MKQDMNHQAAQFVQGHQLAISDAKTFIVEIARQFIAAVGSAMPADVARVAKDKIENGDVVDFGLMVRQYPVKVVAKIGSSTPYWHMIDACNFFWDATSTQWPYMTTEKREISLKWAADHASMVCISAWNSICKQIK